jgi:cytochrome c oxidase subunit 2
MMTLLIVLVAALVVIAIAQIVRIFELSANIRGDQPTEVSDAENATQGKLMYLFLFAMLIAFIGWTIQYWDLMLPESASAHGFQIDNLMAWSMGLISIVFFITHIVLFYFTYKYRGKKGNKATFYAHDNKLELIWTIIPAIVLTGLIIYGLRTWSTVMDNSNEDAMVVEVYARQFDWTFRYAGADNVLGEANVRWIEGANTLGVNMEDAKAADDIITTELHLPVDRPVLFKFRSQDVIHSAYMPHFRAQMNTVPGMTTEFSFTPVTTTAEMRLKPEVVKNIKHINELRAKKGVDPYEFDFILLCNKICGTAHYNMQRKIVVDTEEEFETYMAEQTPLVSTL